MPNDTRTWIEWLKGKRYNNIELENESGMVDPRLKGKSVREALDKAAKNFKGLQKSAIFRGLQEAADDNKKKK